MNYEAIGRHMTIHYSIARSFTSFVLSLGSLQNVSCAFSSIALHFVRLTDWTFECVISYFNIGTF